MKPQEQHKIQVENSEAHTKKENKMLVFKCSCGARISIVPDFPEMGKAIKAHAIEHKRLTGQPLMEETITELIIKTIAEYQT